MGGMSGTAALESLRGVVVNVLILVLTLLEGVALKLYGRELGRCLNRQNSREVGLLLVHGLLYQTVCNKLTHQSRKLLVGVAAEYISVLLNQVRNGSALAAVTCEHLENSALQLDVLSLSLRQLAAALCGLLIKQLNLVLAELNDCRIGCALCDNSVEHISLSNLNSVSHTLPLSTMPLTRRFWWKLVIFIIGAASALILSI